MFVGCAVGKLASLGWLGWVGAYLQNKGPAQVGPSCFQVADNGAAVPHHGSLRCGIRVPLAPDPRRRNTLRSCEGKNLHEAGGG